MIYSLAPLFLLLCLKKRHTWLNPITSRFNYTPMAGFHRGTTPAMLTGDWPHFVFMIANLKWTFSTGRQPDRWVTPQSCTGPAHPFSSPFKPLTHLGLHDALIVDDLVSHFTKKIEAIQRPCPSLLTTNLPQGLPLPLYALPFFPLWWMNGLHSNVRKVFPSICCPDFFLSCHSRTLFLQFPPFSRVSLISLPCGSLQLAQKYAVRFLLKNHSFDSTCFRSY